MAPNSLLLAACLLACCASLTLAGDRILPTVSPACKDQFNTIIKEQYAGDAECADLIKKAMNTAPTTAADCPGGKEAAAGSAVQKCMSKNEVGREACRQQWQQSQQSAGGGGEGALVIAAAAGRQQHRVSRLSDARKTHTREMYVALVSAESKGGMDDLHQGLRDPQRERGELPSAAGP